MFRTVFLPALLALAVTLSLVSSADARKRRGYIELYVPRSAAYGPEVRPTAPRDPVQSGFGAGGIGNVITRLVRDCHVEATQLKNWPFESIARIAVLDETQRTELDGLRTTTHEAAERLAAECPQPFGTTAARVEAVEQAADAADSAFARIEPALQGFYASLDDEQKARILRDLTLSQRKAENPDGVSDRKRDRRRRSSARASASPPPAGPPWAGLCQDFTRALRTWPTHEIEQRVRLNETQRVAFYELVTASLKAAETLADRCPAEAPITPVRRMAVLRVSLHAVRNAATSIKPSFAQFYQALDEAQQAKFAEAH